MREELIEPTPERIAKGGIAIHRDPDGNFLSCVPESPLAIDWLIDRKFISMGEYSAARRFMMMRHAFQRRTEAVTSRFDSAHGANAEVGMADDYSAVIRQMSRADCDLVIWIQEHRYCAEHRQALFDGRNRIAFVLGRLERTMENIRDERNRLREESSSANQ